MSLGQGIALGAGTIDTVVGTGQSGYSPDGTPAASAMLDSPTGIAFSVSGGIAFDPSGRLLLSDGNRVRMVGSDGLLVTVAGTGEPGLSGDGGPALQAKVTPGSLAFDLQGNLYLIAAYQRVRKIDPQGIISTVAGAGDTPYSLQSTGDEGPATKARFISPTGIALSESGKLYISDASRIRVVDHQGIIHEWLFSADSYGLATDRNSLYYSEDHFSVVYQLPLETEPHSESEQKVIAGGNNPASEPGFPTGDFRGDGGPATQAALSTPGSIALDAAGNLFIADIENKRIRKVDSQGIITTVAGNGTAGYSGDGGPATDASFGQFGDLAIDPEGNLYINDPVNYRIQRVSGVAAPGMIAGKPFPGNGDVNRDGKTDLADAVLALRGFIGTAQLSAEARAFADTDASLTLDLGDVISILRKSVGL